MVNFYAEDPEPAVASAMQWIPSIGHQVLMNGRYDGFKNLDGGRAPLFASEHVKRNAMLAAAERWASPDRWLLWLDCDERVTYASPTLRLQLERLAGDVAGVRFVQPLDPNAPGLRHPGRRVRDKVVTLPRLIRHLPGLRYRHRHDYLVDGSGNLLVGWEDEGPAQPDLVDLAIVHTNTQTSERVEAKHAYYAGPVRSAESQPRR